MYGAHASNPLREFRASLADDPMAVRTARRFIVDTMRGLGLVAVDGRPEGDVVEAALLVTSELVTNACRHTPGVVELRLIWDGRVLTIEVEDKDGGASLPEIVPPSDRGCHGGFGMDLVDRLSEKWGASCHRSGKTVFARIRHAAATAAAPAAYPTVSAA